ncbi:MAG: hypothetical protein ACP5D2_04070, partial [Candidatus Nanoarchaeia archaeon]
MISRKAQVSMQVLLLVVSIFAFAFLLADVKAEISEGSYCCEKTEGGAYCINAEQDKCDENYKMSPTSCQSTSYCKLGTCYDSQEGICMENTPLTTCKKQNGTWSANSIEEVPQCQLGCCVIGQEAAYVTLVRCKRLSSQYGVDMDYRTNINSETACIATAQSQELGACVYEQDFQRTCELTTRAGCSAEEVVESVNDTQTGKKFYPNRLCSAEELNTICAPTHHTDCYQGKVYWYDSCGNRENIYTPDKDRSWNNGRIAKPDEICEPVGASKECGNCDYLQGARCGEAEFLDKPEYGDYVCKETTCTDDGEERKNGESWCVYPSAMGNGTDPAGSRYFKKTCKDGEILIEPCADYRNEICVQNNLEDFSYATCRVNRWQDCVTQQEEEDCLNNAQRDCYWIKGVEGMIVGNSSKGVCLPEYAPGLEFWEGGEAEGVCGQASAQCEVVIEKGLIGGEDVVEGEECLEESWAIRANEICRSLGDCGGYVNYVGEYTNDGYLWTEDGKKKTFSPNTINKISSPFTGKVIMALFALVSGYAVDEYGREIHPKRTINEPDVGETSTTKTPTNGGAAAAGIILQKGSEETLFNLPEALQYKGES